MKNSIAICITTHNRYSVFKRSFSEWHKYKPDNADIFVVDDSSEFPVPEATLRFNENVGIAAAKNACFRLSENYDHIFLVDDDVFPIVDKWWEPYIKSGENHLMLIFEKLHNGAYNGNAKIKQIGNLTAYKNPCGCMLYYKNICLKTVGGMDEKYGIWGFEHVDLSRRIHNAGLTSSPYMDVTNSKDLFHAHDYYLSVERSVSSKVRGEHIKKNQKAFNDSAKSKEYIPYKQLKNTLITTYFTGVADPQRGVKWKKDIKSLDPLINSLAGETLVVLHDCFTAKETKVYPDNVRFIKVKTSKNPYFQRWESIYDHLKQYEYRHVFCVDATDVVMLRSPFKAQLGEYLYVGDEPETIANKWLQKHHDTPMLNEFYKEHQSSKLLNAGILGGQHRDVMSFIGQLVEYFKGDVGFSDMGIFNYLCYNQGIAPIMHGRKVNTIFKSFKANDISWFQHK
jgi:glycosyltransferase involved in cell wall biosynthesis